ncbi:MAG TPA: MGMT family protein [Steroidobacteraceae bacterium]|nr:MGMT family protein [Steroidobacteraceae bacterium]
MAKRFHPLFRPLSAAQEARARRPALAGQSPAIEAIWQVVQRVPRGRVATYGEVARAAGLPGRARLTGRALRKVPPDMHLPWHRILGAGGRIVFARQSPHHREQARLLRSEGVPVKDGRVPRSAIMTAEEL